MGGIVGRLFREFSITVTAAIAVSALVSLILTPMLCARFLHHESGQHGLVWRAIEAVFDGMLSFYRRTLDGVLRHPFITLMVFFATMAASVYLYVAIPKGFFPIQDTGLVTGFRRGGAGHLTARDGAADGAARRRGSEGSRTSPPSGQPWAAPAARKPPIPGAFSSGLSRAISAAPTRAGSSTGCDHSLRESRASSSRFSHRRTSP